MESLLGHVTDTYHDIASKVEVLRTVYTTSAISIRPKTQVSKIEMLMQVTKAWALDPDRILTKEALA